MGEGHYNTQYDNTIQHSTTVAVRWAATTHKWLVVGHPRGGKPPPQGVAQQGPWVPVARGGFVLGSAIWKCKMDDRLISEGAIMHRLTSLGLQPVSLMGWAIDIGP
jgi:hypothetical protein